jgi:ABC-type Fe3+ transport system substrate-binding protein
MLSVIAGCDATSQDAPVHAPLVVYVSADGALAKSVLDAFTQETGTHVVLVGDTEAFKSTGLARRIRGERARPVADVFWSSEIAQVAKLANYGVLEPVRTPYTQDWPAQWRDTQHRWHGFSPRPRVAVWDASRLGDIEPPTTWLEAVDGRFGGAVVMADPRFGTTGGHLASMRQYWLDTGQPDVWSQFVKHLQDGQVRMLSGGNAATVDAVCRGEALLGWTDLDDARSAKARGCDLTVAFLRHDATPGGGAMLTPNAVARVRNGPNGERSQALVEWLLSDTCAAMLAASASANMPLSLAVQRDFPSLVVDDPLAVDHTAAAMHYDETLNEVLGALNAGDEAH